MEHGSISISDCWFHISLRMTMFRFMIGLTLNWIDSLPFRSRGRSVASAWRRWQLVINRRFHCRLARLFFRDRAFDERKIFLGKSLDKHRLPHSRLIGTPPWIRAHQLGYVAHNVVAVAVFGFWESVSLKRDRHRYSSLDVMTNYFIETSLWFESSNSYRNFQSFLIQTISSRRLRLNPLILRLFVSLTSPFLLHFRLVKNILSFEASRA